ncbi:hypothetical protein POF50_011065 [Streptomyces sp. SL13]|uniref:Uncharacterized protein n=1 Tax=Streptantibioticus silvisoli TaxID=2705255 RepID=A0AA90KG91_9ACTN|nr:hypothetical protein [Streptantibioticus silvisoli]MDI5969869.1 hypothetical protein [Streptantibioticus silvisoli]
MNAAATDATARSWAANLRRARKDIGHVVALLTTPEDFGIMRQQFRSFRYTDYDAYLNQMQYLLDSLAETSSAYVTVFDPAAFADFCAREELEPDSPSSRSRYAAGAAVQEVRLPYEGDEVSDLMDDLMEAVDKRQSLEKAMRIIGTSSLGGMPPYEFLDRARTAVGELLRGLGTGTHHLVCSVAHEAERLVAVLHVACTDEGVTRVPEDDRLPFTVHVAAGLRSGGVAGIVARTSATQNEANEVVRGWTISEGWVRPLTEAQVFAAYCTDADTGEPIPPEHRVEYAAGFPVAGPEQ